MTLSDIKTKLKTTGYPVAYDHFAESETPELPFITFEENNSTNFYADGEVYFHKGEVTVTLWTTIKDSEAEDKLKTALDGISWQKGTEDYNDTEKIYYSEYTFEITE